MTDHARKEKFLPVDLGRLEEVAKCVVECFDNYHLQERSPEYREYMLKRAESLARTHARNFGYYFDTKEIGGMIPYGLDEKDI